MKYHKIIFLVMTILGSLITISSYSWFSMWIGLEVNLLSIIPILTNYKNKFPAEAAFKYFIIQSAASTMLMFSMILSMNLTEQILMGNKFTLLMLYSSVLTKMGAAPFHAWFPEVVEGLSWLNCLLMLTWQKIAPMMILMQNYKLSLFFSFVILTSSFVGGVMGLNQISLRKILAYSSINHISWMLSSMAGVKMIWMIYFLIYSMISITIILSFKLTKTFYIHQIYTLKYKKALNLMINLNFLSLGGLPPFLGFFPKWLTINFLIYQNNFLLLIMLVIFTLISLYVYTRILFSSFTIIANETKIPSFKINKFYIFFMNLLTLSSLLVCPILTISL